MPSTFTAFQSHTHRTSGPRGLFTDHFTLEVRCEWEKLDACRIGSTHFHAAFRSHKPGWHIVSRSAKPIQRLDADSPECTSSSGAKGKMDRVIGGYDYVLEYRVLSIPTPWGSIGGVTPATVELSFQLTITPDGAVSADVR